MFRCNYKSFPHTYQLDFSHGAFFFFHSFHRAPFIGADIGSICDHYLTNSSSLRRLFWCQTICFYFVVLVEKSKKKKKEDERSVVLFLYQAASEVILLSPTSVSVFVCRAGGGVRYLIYIFTEDFVWCNVSCSVAKSTRKSPKLVLIILGRLI